MTLKRLRLNCEGDYISTHSNAPFNNSPSTIKRSCSSFQQKQGAEEGTDRPKINFGASLFVTNNQLVPRTLLRRPAHWM